MTIGNRIKMIRKDRKLTMLEFGESLGLTKAAISSLESGKNNPSERTVRLICSVYKADYFWLTEGKGEMYVNNTEILIESLVAEQSINQETARMLKRFLNLSSESQEIVLRAIDTLLDEHI